jgi:hypothetical protein
VGLARRGWGGRVGARRAYTCLPPPPASCARVYLSRGTLAHDGSAWPTTGISRGASRVPTVLWGGLACALALPVEIPDAVCCEDAPESTYTPALAVTLRRTLEVVTRGGQRDVGDGLHAAEDPSRAQLDARQSRVTGGAEGGRLVRTPHVPSSAPGNARRCCAAVPPCRCTGRGACYGRWIQVHRPHDSGFSRARLSPRGADERAQGTAIPPRERAARLPLPRGNRVGHGCNPCWRRSYTQTARCMRLSGWGWVLWEVQWQSAPSLLWLVGLRVGAGWLVVARGRPGAVLAYGALSPRTRCYEVCLTCERT